MEGRGRFEHRERRFETADLDGVFLVINTVPDEPELARQVHELACRQGSLINTWDRPAQSNIAMAALVSSGHLRVSISTSNASPSLARRLREDLERIFDDSEFVDYLDGSPACAPGSGRRSLTAAAGRRYCGRWPPTSGSTRTSESPPTGGSGSPPCWKAPRGTEPAKSNKKTPVRAFRTGGGFLLPDFAAQISSSSSSSNSSIG